MSMCRAFVHIGFLGSAYCLIGCDALPAAGDADSLGESSAVMGEFFSAPINEFANARAVTVEAYSVTTVSTTVVLPNDLWESEPEEATLVLDASAITLTVAGESSKRAQLTAKGGERRAMMIVHIAPPDHDACGSESVVGPFDMTIVDGVVTLTNESQPLDADGRSTVGNGRFEICAEIWADFDGVISIENAAFEFGTIPDNEERVEICHVPPGNPGNAHTITVAASAVPAHLTHGDYLGECEASDDATDDDSTDVVEDDDTDDSNPDDDDADGRDSGDEDDAQPADVDSDGVDDTADLCPNTPEGETANETGCSCTQLDVDADGVNDCDDTCPDSVPGTAVTGTGCAEENPSDDPSDKCYVEYDYTVIGNDGHSLYLDGEYVDGAGFGQNLNGTLRLSCGEHSLDVVLYNSVAGGAILFGSKIDDVWTVASEHPQITLRADDGTPDAWSVYRKLDCGYHSPFDFVPEIDSFETTFWSTVPERGAGVWNTNDATKDHWIIWDDYASTVVFPQSFWVSRTTLIVTGNETTNEDDDADGVHNDIDACLDTAIDAAVDETGCSCEQLGTCDSDGDGVPDQADNCPDDANPDQADADEDGVGDACDAGNDTDGDGIEDVGDNCPVHPNPGQEDCDGDAIGDVCAIADGTSQDCNANGIPDECDTIPVGGFLDVSSWATYDPGDNGVGIDPDGYKGSAFDGQYVYFVPYHNGKGYHGEVLRYDATSDFSLASSWTTYDPGANGVGNDPTGYNRAVFDGQYVYFVPNRNSSGYHGEVLRYDTVEDFAVASSWATFDPGSNGVGNDADGYLGAAFDGRYVYFSPDHNGSHRHGEVLRYDTEGAFSDVSSWTAYDAGAHGVGNDPDGYWGAIFVGHYVYFVPIHNGTDFHGEVMRYDTDGVFSEASSWVTFNPGDNGVGNHSVGYVGAVSDSRYIYFVPFNTLYGPEGYGLHGEVLRFDTSGDFSDVSSWAAFDAGDNGVGTDPDGYKGAVFDGTFIYFVPQQNEQDGINRHGEVLRYDTGGAFSEVSSWATFDPGDNGVGDDPDGFNGAVFDGRFIYFVPEQNGTEHHGEVLRYDTTGCDN